MQANPSGQGNQGGNRQSGLSWSTPSTNQNAAQSAPSSPLLGGAKPASTSSTKPVPPPAASKARADADTTGRGRTFGIFIAGVVVGALLMWGWNAGNGARPASTDTTNTNNTGAVGNTETGNTTGNTGNTTGSTIGSVGGSGVTTPSTGGTPAPKGVTSTTNIEVASQDAGTSVYVTDATVSAPTWLVVYELYQGKAVRALGATMFFPEYNGKGGVISLLRATQPHTTYFIGQSLDTGTHTFTPHVNKEVLDASGNMEGATFTTK